MSYAKHFSTLATPQHERAKQNQVENSAGGFTFKLDKWSRLDRWLILGCEGGTYYAGEKKLTVENAKTVIECLDEDCERAVNTIAYVSLSGLAPKNDPAIFALAIAAGHGNPACRKLALGRLHTVCRTSTHLFQFMDAVRNFRGYGSGLRKAIAKWYTEMPIKKLGYQAVKYRNRHGYTHRDALRLSHPKATSKRQANTFDYICRGVTHSDLPDIVAGYEAAKTAGSIREMCNLIERHGLTHEMVPDKFKHEKAVWEALLVKMPIAATVRNLGRMTSIGLMGPFSESANIVCDRLSDASVLVPSRLHPLSILVALKTYASGHGLRGSLSWSPNQMVLESLNSAFYKSFGNIEPTGKRRLLALDVSGSMSWGTIAGMPINPAEASAAMAMVAARTEQVYHIMGFANKFRDLGVCRADGLDKTMALTRRRAFGPTDCALPMIWALKNNVPVDSFEIFTDNQTWAGDVHPHQALEHYRRKTGIHAKCVVAGMTSNGFSIADPDDSGMIDVVGFDAASPNVVANFVRDGF